jgi:hypothetical protein
MLKKNSSENFHDWEDRHIVDLHRKKSCKIREFANIEGREGKRHRKQQREERMDELITMLNDGIQLPEYEERVTFSLCFLIPILRSLLIIILFFPVSWYVVNA